MPNELKNALKASTSHVTSNHTMSRQLPAAGSSTVSVMVWTISGIVLASCGGGGGGAGGGRPTVARPSPNGEPNSGFTANGPTRVVDGPVEGAAVYFDIDGDGEVFDSEREAQRQDGRPMYMTDANGEVNTPIAFRGRFFIADVNGAIDTATGDTLSGEYKSLSTGGIATPITDLIADRIGTRGSDADAQGVLDDIFGADDLVTVDDIRNPENYKILEREDEVPKPTLPSDPTDAQQEQYNRDIAEYKISVIMKSSLALSEIDKDDGAFENLVESPTARVNALRQTFDNDPSNDVSALEERISERVEAGREILGGKPLALPERNIDPIDEDSVFTFPQNSEAILGSEDIFGFYDPNGNSNAAASDFTGIYVKLSVGFSQADDGAHTVNLLYDGSPLSRHEVAGGDSPPGNLPPETGFYYVSSENLSRLSIRPSDDDSGTLELEYYVFDGEQWSDKASLEITVSPVNEAPTATPRAGISTNDHRAYALEAVDFGFSDVDADDSQFHSVIITSLPGAEQGTLVLNGTSVRAGDEITFTDINNGRLIYMPSAVQEGGQPYNAQIGYRVQDDGDGNGVNSLSSAAATLAIRVGANQPATAVSVIAQGRVTEIDENTDLTGGMKVADLDVTDTDGAPHRLTLSGTNAGLFAIRNEDELWLVLQEGATLDFEATPTLTVQVEVSGAPAINTGAITVTVNNVNDNLPMITHSGRQIPLFEGTFSVDTNTRYRYTARDADGGTPALSVSEGSLLPDDPRNRFAIDASGNLQIKTGSTFDYENPADRAITLTITAADSGVGSGNQPINTTETVIIRLGNINDNPPVITQSGRQVPLDEGTFSSDTNTGYSYTVSDADTPGRALLIPRVSGDLQNRFAIDASGNLQIKAGSEFNYESLDEGAITLTITATDSGVGPGSPAVTDTEMVTITFEDVNVNDNPSDYSVEIYESHPLYRPIEIDSVDLQGYQLTQGYVDNALFTIDEDGQVWWKAVSDYEGPRDGDRDNIYEIELSRTNNGQIDRIQVDIRVKDIGIGPTDEEDYVPRFFLVPTDIADEHLPSDFVQHLIVGETWKVPETGPVTIQYSFDTDQLATLYNNNQEQINRFHSILEASLLSFEQAANLKFIEVAHNEDDDDTPYIYLEFSLDVFSLVTHLDGDKDTRITLSTGHIGPDKIDTDTNGVQYTIIHELGHALGLHHPFEEGGKLDRPGLIWPGDEDYRYSPLSVMSYNTDVSTLQPADIEALKYLYGAPRTDFMGVEGIREESQFARELSIGPPTLTEIDENTDLTAGIKVADITVTDEDGGAFGTLEVAGDHAEFFAIRNSTELWLVLKEGKTLENITMLEVHVRLVEKNGTRTDDITIVVNDAGSSGAEGSSGLVGAAGDADQIRIDETVDEGQGMIANLIDLDLGEIDLTEITIGGDDKDHVRIRPTQNGGVLEFVSAPDFEAPEDDDEDNVYEITLHDDLTSIEVDVTVIDIPEI